MKTIENVVIEAKKQFVASSAVLRNEFLVARQEICVVKDVLAKVREERAAWQSLQDKSLEADVLTILRSYKVKGFVVESLYGEINGMILSSGDCEGDIEREFDLPYSVKDEEGKYIPAILKVNLEELYILRDYLRSRIEVKKISRGGYYESLKSLKSAYVTLEVVKGLRSEMNAEIVQMVACERGEIIITPEGTKDSIVRRKEFYDSGNRVM
jgi:hypothetical protein